MGAEYCRQLADQGLNVVMISRTLSKLQKVNEEIMKKNVKTMVIEADFEGNNNFQFYKEIKNKIKGLDISMLIVNAGVISFGPFHL